MYHCEIMFLNRKDIDMERFTQNFRLSRSERERGENERRDQTEKELKTCLSNYNFVSLRPSYRALHFCKHVPTMKLKLDKWVNIKNTCIKNYKLHWKYWGMQVCLMWKIFWCGGCSKYSEMVDVTNILLWGIWQNWQIRVFLYGSMAQ